MGRPFSTTRIAARRLALALVVILTAAAMANAAEKSKRSGKADKKLPPPPAAEKKSDGQPVEAAIRATADAFVKAFDAGDAKAVAALWTPEGSVVDDDGQVIKGRKAIKDRYAAMFKKYPGARIEVAVKSVEVASPDTAIEDGLARVITKEGTPPVASRYTAVHVLKDGKWLMAGVRESDIALPSSYGRLRDLGWLVGDWEADANGTRVHTSIRWMADRSFLERRYTVVRDGITSSTGLQIIGWDPQAEQVRSWSFDSTGGHGTALWMPTPDGWRIESTGMMADGAPTSSQESLIRVAGEDDVVGWRSTGRRVGGTQLPDTREVVLKRVSGR